MPIEKPAGKDGQLMLKKLLAYSSNNLTSTEEVYFVGDLPLKNRKQTDYAIMKIAQIAFHHQMGTQLDEHEMLLSEEIKLVQDVISLGKKYRAALTKLGSRIYSEEGWSELSFDIQQNLSDVQESLIKFLENEKPSSGRPRDIQYDYLAISLILLWEELTNKIPGLSSAPASKNAENDNNIHGPFLRFCRNIFALFYDLEIEQIRTLLRRNLARRKKGVNFI